MDDVDVFGRDEVFGGRGWSFRPHSSSGACGLLRRCACHRAKNPAPRQYGAGVNASDEAGADDAGAQLVAHGDKVSSWPRQFLLVWAASLGLPS